MYIYISKFHHRTGHEGPEEEYRHSSTLSLTSALDGVGSQRHAPAALPPGKKSRYPLYVYMKLGGPRSGSGRVRKFSPPTGIRSPDLPARRKLLYRLSYPGLIYISIYIYIYICVYYLLTPWCGVLLEKLTGLQLVKKFPAFYGTRSFIAALTSVRHLSLFYIYIYIYTYILTLTLYRKSVVYTRSDPRQFCQCIAIIGERY